jgi:hypothetical protein
MNLLPGHNYLHTTANRESAGSRGPLPAISLHQAGAHSFGFGHGDFQRGHDPGKAGATSQAILETPFKLLEETGDKFRSGHAFNLIMLDSLMWFWSRT